MNNPDVKFNECSRAELIELYLQKNEEFIERNHEYLKLQKDHLLLMQELHRAQSDLQNYKSAYERALEPNKPRAAKCYATLANSSPCPSKQV